MIILVGGEKGGTGKTTLATNLAQIRNADGFDTLLLDTDKQESASRWCELREDNHLSRIPCLIKRGKTLAREINDLKPRYQDIVIDAGGRDSVELRGAMVVADRLYIPIRASQFDVMTLTTMQELVSQAKAMNPTLEAYVLINQASTNVRVSKAANAKKILQSDDLPDLVLAQTTIRERIAFQTAAEFGKGVAELGEGKAMEEMMQLYKEVFHAT